MGSGSKDANKPWPWENFSEEELRLILKRAWPLAKRWGFSAEQSEDFAVNTLMKAVETNNHYPTSGRAVMNEIKRENGRKGSFQYDFKQNLVSQCFDSDGFYSNDYMDELDTKFKRERAIERIKLTELPPINRAIALLAIEWGFRAHEIGECFGLTYQRIIEILKDPFIDRPEPLVYGKKGQDLTRGSAPSLKDRRSGLAKELLRVQTENRDLKKLIGLLEQEIFNLKVK